MERFDPVEEGLKRAEQIVLPGRLDHAFSGKSQDSVLFGSQQVGMRHVKPNLPVRKTLEASVIEKAEVPGVDNGAGSKLGNQFVYASELAVGIADEQDSHQIILGSLKIAVYLK